MFEALVSFSLSRCLSVPRFSCSVAFLFFTDIHTDNMKTTRTSMDDRLWTEDPASARLTEGLDDPTTSASPALPR